MLIVCPNCASEYEVPVARLKPGKMVRCASCGSNWVPGPDAAATAPATQAEPPADPPFGMTAGLPQLTAMDRLAASAPREPPRTALRGAWVATFVVLAGAMAAMVVWRHEVVRAWPPASRILASTDQALPQPGQSATGHSTTGHSTTGQSGAGQSGAGQSATGQAATGHSGVGHSGAEPSAPGPADPEPSALGRTAAGQSQPGHSVPVQVPAKSAGKTAE